MNAKQVPCPRCGAPATLSPQNKWRPFCSERCKVIDLGDWAAERYRVATGEKPEDSAETENKSDDPG